MGVRGLLTLAILALGACASFGDASSPDAGSGAPLGPDPDAGGVDAPSSGGEDAGVDAPGDSASGECPHTFCADFDSDPYEHPFDGHLQNDTKIVLSPVPANAGRALRTAIPIGTYGIGSAHYLRKKLAPVPKRVTFGFRVRVTQAPEGLETNTVQVATVGWGAEDGGGDRFSEIQTRVGPDFVLAKRDEGPGNDTPGTPRSLKVGVWMEVKGEISFKPARATTVLVTVDDQVTLTLAFTSDSDPIDLDIGVGCAGLDFDQLAPILYDVDDVWMDIEAQ